MWSGPVDKSGLSMSDLEGVEEIAKQASIRVNERVKRGKFGWNISPNIERASVAREGKKAPPKKTSKKSKAKKAAKPVAARSPPSTGRPAAVAQGFTSYRSTRTFTRGVRSIIGPAGYSAKLLGRDGCGLRQKRAWPLSLEALLGALGLQVVLIVNEEATAKTLARREKPVNRSQQRFGNVSRISAVPALPPPASRETLVSCAEEEATAA
jgi:hypothetical protein